MLAYVLAVLAGVVAGVAYRGLGGLGGVAALAVGAAIVIAVTYAPTWPHTSAQIARIGAARFAQALIGFAIGAFSFVLVLTVGEASAPAEVLVAMTGVVIGLGWALNCVRRRVS